MNGRSTDVRANLYSLMVKQIELTEELVRVANSLGQTNRTLALLVEGMLKNNSITPPSIAPMGDDL
jgi:hypothetical protein